MKIKTIALSACMIGLSSFASASSVYSPSKGVICDKKSGFCADSYGISMGLTKDYLGQAAQNKLMGYKDLDTTSFAMSNGLFCDAGKIKRNK